MTGIDRPDARPGGRSYPALLGGVEMANDPKTQSMVGARTFASSNGGDNAMLTIDWLFAE